MDIFDNKFIFVSFEPGGGGHRLGRVISCLPDVYWYSDTNNGINPWNVHFTETSIMQRKVSRCHFDRLVPKGMLPPTHDYIKDFIPDADEYYAQYFNPQFERMGGPEILKTQHLVYCTHAMPHEITERFTNAKVLNIIDDPLQVAVRYMKTTSLFPAYLKCKWLDGENTEHGKKLARVAEDFGKGFTVRDLWCYDKFDDSYHPTYAMEYQQYVVNMINDRIQQRKTYDNHNNILTVGKRDYKAIKEFLRDL